MRKLVVATRKSVLALTQCRALLKQLTEFYPDLEVAELQVVTSGDKIADRSLSEIGGKGLFVKEIEEAILEGRADIAVHSLKDVPAEVPLGLSLSCVPRREDPRDVLVSKSGCRFAELPEKSRIGTSSLRRQVQLLSRRPDLSIVPLRGNVDTRLQKCRDGVVDAVVLAAAGLYRLGRADEITELLGIETCLPAIGQGALVIEQRQDDSKTEALVRRLHDPETALCVAAERGVMVAVEGNCQTPVAALGRIVAHELWLTALLAEPDGSQLRKLERRVPIPDDESEAHALGLELGRILLEREPRASGPAFNGE